LQTQNRCALLLQLPFWLRNCGRKTATHFCSNCPFGFAIANAKPLRTFAAIALLASRLQAQNRCALLLQLL
jgi:hypothetical protein